MKTKMIKLAIIIFIIIVTVVSYILIIDFLEYKESNDSSIDLLEKVTIEDDGKKEEKVNINWNELEKINKDIVGWIKIANTNINYPILKDYDNLKYLKHSFNGKYNRNGAIFTLNSKPFQDDETIIYGHNNNNGIMFSELSNYMNEGFFDENRNFIINTREQDYNATIFSCYSIGESKEQDNIKKLDFQEEIEYYKNISQKSVNDIGEIKKIVKLSTCSYLNNRATPTNQRYYIVAKLEKAN